MELQELQDRHRKEIEEFRQLAAAGSGGSTDRSVPANAALAPTCSGN